MSLTAMLTRTATITRRDHSGADAWGDQAPTVVTIATTAAYLEPKTSVEILEGQTTVVSTHLLVVPKGTAVGAHDLVDVDGALFSVVGEPRRFHRPSTGEHHVEADLVAAKG